MALLIKSPRDIEQMRCAGALLWRLIDEAVASIKPGITTGQLGEAFERRLLAAGAEPVMRSIGFPGAASICVNEEAVHGVPGARILRDGDVVTFDAALRLGGWSADAARCVEVGVEHASTDRTIAAARLVAQAAIGAIVPGRRWSEVIAVAHQAAALTGATILAYSGHGIGRDLHELPAAGFASLLRAESGNRTPDGQDFILRPGLVLTVEPVVTLGGPHVRALDDGWTEVLLDRSLAAHEERTVAVTRQGPVVLTGP
jgi:methionyl aminopeptidase